ncbi:hypothetical protein FRC00_007058 [Tulasnella sp. 408]|nr:hypothetical protein FRC00_007058 [Tulasnella sp. 408]
MTGTATTTKTTTTTTTSRSVSIVTDHTTTTKTSTTSSKTSTTTAPAGTGVQIRTVQDPVYHLYLQNDGGTAVIGPEASSGHFTINGSIKLNGANLYLNIASGTTSYRALTFDSTASFTGWALEGDTIITSQSSQYGRQLNFLACQTSVSGEWQLYLQLGNDQPSGHMDVLNGVGGVEWTADGKGESEGKTRSGHPKQTQAKTEHMHGPRDSLSPLTALSLLALPVSPATASGFNFLNIPQVDALTMATPSSQKTTPSPPTHPASLMSLDATGSPSSLKRARPGDQSAPNLDAFLQRAHIGKLASELSTRLKYAAFKTSNRISDLPFTSVERQFTSKPRPSPSAIQQQQRQQQHTLPPKHKLTHTQSMPPPPSPGGQSLYSALLGSNPMPPAKRARHDGSPNLGGTSRHAPPPTASQFIDPNGTRNIHNSGKRPQGSSNEPDDITAAATLTSLLLNRPNSRSEGGSSLSRTSSAASVTTFVQSSQPTLSQQSQVTAASSSFVRSQSFGVHSRTGSNVTITASSQPLPERPTRPKTPQTDDAQAAELMLFLATSPSPARSNHSRTRSESRPGALLPKARVLFTGNDTAPGVTQTPKAVTSNNNQPKLEPAAALLPTPSSSSQLLPPASPSSSNASFNIGDYINTSPLPPPPKTSSTPKPSFRGEGRRLFADELDNTSTSESSTRHFRQPSWPASAGPLFSAASPGHSGPGATKKDAPMMGLPPAPVLGPAMGANG